MEEMALWISRPLAFSKSVAFEDIWSPGSGVSLYKNLVQQFESELKIKYVIIGKRWGDILNTSLPVLKI